MRFQFITDYRGSLSRSRICRLMGVTDRGLRAWKRRPPSLRQRRDLILLAHIREQHRLCLGSYGRPRMTEELKALGLQVGQRRVGRLMRQNNITVVRTRKFKRTTDSHHTFNIAPNLLKQDFSASAPNQKWAGDITYVWTREGWVYLAVILDLYSRRVIGWATGDRLKQDLALRALNMALALRKPPPGCIQHTDRGSQYCAHEYQKLLLKHQLLPAMRGKGNCFDNSAVESFFKSLKAELIWRRHWQTRRDIEIAIFEYYEKRGNAENYIKEAKYDMAVGHLLLKSFWANEAVFQMMMLSYNLFLLFKFDSLDSSEYRQQIKTFRLKYVFLAAKIIKTARYVIMKLSENYPYKGVYEKCLV